MSSGSTATASCRSSRRSLRARRLLALPAPTNAHDHCRVTSTSAYGGAGKPLETWIAYLALLPSIDPYLAAAVSLSRSALGGAGAVMVHYTRIQGLTDLPTEAADVARAARDVGVRVGFAVDHAQPQPFGLRALGADSGRAVDASPRRSSEALHAAAVAGGRADRADRRRRQRRGQPDVRRAIWSAGGAMVHARSVGGDCGCLQAHRPPHPYAPAGDQHAAGLARRQLSRRHRQIPRQHRVPQPAPDARPLHLGAARRAGADR